MARTDSIGRRLLLSLTVIAVVSTLAWWTTLHRVDASTTKPAAPPVPVVSALAALGDLPDFIGGVGSVQAGASVTVRARVDGQLEELLFKEGQDVTAGQLLARIDPRALQAQLEQARAQKAKDEALLTNARADLGRYEDLNAKDSVSRQTLYTQRAQVAQFEALVKTDQALLDLAEVQRGYAIIRAPISGRTGMQLTDVGNLVRASEVSGIVVINQIDQVNLLFSLPEGALERVRAALHAAGEQALEVLALGRDESAVLGKGRLLLVNNQIDTGTGTVQLKAVFPNQEHQLWPGQYVNARLILGLDLKALVVPAAAVQRGPDGPFVYVIGEEGKAQLRPVHVVKLQDGKALIGTGLTVGERVVVAGQAKLRNGARVAEAGQSDGNPPRRAGKPGTPN